MVKSSYSSYGYYSGLGDSDKIISNSILNRNIF